MKRQPALPSGPDLDDAAASRPASFLLSGLAERLAARVRRDVFSAPVRFVLWNGKAIAFGEPHPDGGYFDLYIRNARTLRQLLWDPANAFGDGYGRGDIDYAGDLV